MKFQHDDFCLNAELAHVCGIDLEELNGLEKYTLEILDYRVWISEEEFKAKDD